MNAIAMHRPSVRLWVSAVGILLVAIRSPGWGATLIVVVVAIAAALLTDGDGSVDYRRWTIVAGAGCLLFASTALLWRDPVQAIRPSLTAVGASVVAAVAEELLFRRALFGSLLEVNVPFAIIASAALFAIAHVPNYGWGVLPIDFTAGLVFSWQRQTSGTWTAPAVTHSFANLVQVI